MKRINQILSDLFLQANRTAIRRLQHINRTFCLQEEETDCGSACLLSIIRYHKGDETWHRIRQLSGKYSKGTSLAGLYRCAEQLGYKVTGVKMETEYLEKVQEPCILLGRNQMGQNHYLVYYGYDQKGPRSKNNRVFLIGDPSQGLIRVSTFWLKDIWVSKTALLLSPGTNFKKKTDKNHHQWKWLPHLISGDRDSFISILFLSAFIALLSMGTAIFMQQLIDVIIPSKNKVALTAAVCLVFSAMLARSATAHIRERFLIRYNFLLNNKLLLEFISKLSKLPKSFFDGRTSGDFHVRLEDISVLQRNLSLLAGSVVIDIILIVVSLCFLSWYSFAISLIAGIFLMVMLIFINSQGKPIYLEQRKVLKTSIRAISGYADHIHAMMVIRAAQSDAQFVDRTANLFGNHYGQRAAYTKVITKIAFFAELTGVLTLSLLFAFTAFLVVNGSLSIGAMTAVITLLSSLLPAVYRMGQSITKIHETSLSFNRMMEVTDVKNEKKSSANNICINQLDQLIIDNLCFSYQVTKPVFSKVSLQVKRGELVILTGSNGSGKSTLFHLLLRFYEPNDGLIFINGVLQLSTIDLKNWRSMIGYVPQEIHIFDGTILENITLYRPVGSNLSFEAFADTYGFQSYFSAFKDGHDTLLGEHGIKLSGGQKQIIALARALFGHPQLLLLDEPLAALDDAALCFVLDLINKLKATMAILMISHNAATFNMATQIYQMESS